MVGLTVAAGVESTAGDLARRRRDGGDAAQVRPRCFAAETVGVITGGDQQDGGRVGIDTGQGRQTRPALGEQWCERRVEPVDLIGEIHGAAAEAPRNATRVVYPTVSPPRGRSPAASVTNMIVR